MTIKIAILGVGTMGRNHLRILSILKDVDVSYIFDVDKVLLKNLSDEYNVPFTTDACEAIEGVDAVVIVTPTSTHFEYCKLCVGKVKYIFIEKPLAADYEEALAIKALAEQHNSFVQCGFIERFNPVVSALKRIVDAESVINADFTRTNRLSNRITDVNVVLDLMIHDIDLALHLNGPVDKVLAYGKKEHGLAAFVSAIFYHANGAMSRLLASRMTEKKIRSINVTTANLYVESELIKKEITIHKQSQLSQEENKAYIVSSIEQQVEIKPQEALLLELQAFIMRCKGDAAVDVPEINAGVESLRLAQLILDQVEN